MLQIQANTVLLRKLLGVSQAAFGSIIGCTKDMVYSYEHGKAEPSEASMSKMAVILGITTEAFKTARLKASDFNSVEIGQRAAKADNQPKKANTDDYRDKYIATLEKQVASLEAQLNLATGEVRHAVVMNHSLLLTLRDAAAELLAKGSKADLLKVAEKLDTKTASYYRIGRKRGSLVDDNN